QAGWLTVTCSSPAVRRPLAATSWRRAAPTACAGTGSRGPGLPPRRCRPAARSTRRVPARSAGASGWGASPARLGLRRGGSRAGVHDGTTFTQTRDLGTHAVLTQPATARAGHSCTLLQDGTFLVWGGQTPDGLHNIIQTWTDGYVYVQ